MELLLRRHIFTPKTTIGDLFVDGRFECYVLEDRYRPPPEPKVFGETAIPNGRYEVRITRSPRFSAMAGHDVFLPLLVNVPGYEGVRIHPGNKAEDTEGCLLPGRVVQPDRVLNSREAFDALFAKLKATQGPIWLTVECLQPHP